MALTINEIREAALSGKLFTLTDVKLIEMSFDSGKLSFEWSMPEMQDKPYCPGMIVDYISICEQPKYDPCRKFKRGDIVKKHYVHGRSNNAIGSLGLYTVVEDEDTNGGNVVVQDGVAMRYKVKAVFLQLVTPVEELDPYSVLETDTIDGFDIMRDGLCVMTFPYGSKERGWYYNETAAREAAEAECKRLNNLYKQELANNG